MNYQPVDTLLASASTRQAGPVCQTGSIKQADLYEVIVGLKAMWKGTMPEAKPQMPTVVTEALPQSTPQDHVARRARQLKGSRFVSLARCEEQAWAEIQWAATNSRVWSESRALKGMWDAVDSIEHSAESISKQTGVSVDPDELGLCGVTEGNALDQMAADEEAAWKVEAVKAALSDREWTAIQMKAQGLPDQVIADHLQASLPTAKKVVRKARAKAISALA
jgi:DNA-directed RNA polymerase specialized sigma24 family protein